MEQFLTPWQHLLAQPRPDAFWQFIKSLERNRVVVQDDGKHDASIVLFYVFALLQQNKAEQAAEMLHRVALEPRFSWIWPIAHGITAILRKNDASIDGAGLKQAAAFEKGLAFTTLLEGLKVYPALAKALFNHKALQAFWLESAYKTTMYPWLHEAHLSKQAATFWLTEPGVPHLVSVVLRHLSGDHRQALLELAQVIKEQRHWVLLWFMAKSASALGDQKTVDKLVPALLKEKPNFWFARELPLHTKGYYAQLKQDAEAEVFFRSFSPRYKTCIEVGAFDGVHYSNIRRLVSTQGWKGVMVEPVQDNFKRLQHTYKEAKNVTLVNKAISNESGMAELHVSSYPSLNEWGSDIASFDTSEKARWEQYGAQWHTEKVEKITLTELIDAQGWEGVDLLSIDAEGHDLEVLMSLDVKRYKPELIIIEYGKKRRQILEYAFSIGYSLYDDNGQDLLLAAVHDVTPDEVQAQLNPHFLKAHKLGGKLRRQRLKPAVLFSSLRFDLVFKKAYADQYYQGKVLPITEEAYKHHIKAFNNFDEGDGSGKKGYEAFKAAYHTILDDISKNGFKAASSIVPLSKDGVVMDGSHRVAACLSLNAPLEVLRTELPSPFYTAAYFGARGMHPTLLEYGVTKYVEQHPNTYTITVFPRAEAVDEDITKFIASNVPVLYKRSLTMTYKEGYNLIRQMYKNEPWLGDASNQYIGAQNKAIECFKGTGQLHFYVVETWNPASLRELKEKIREMYKVENHSVHINDTHAETTMLVGALLNENSRHFLFGTAVLPFPNFYQLLPTFEAWLKKHGIDPSMVCVDGSAILSAWGIRDCADFDFIHAGKGAWATGVPLINSHNIPEQLQYHAVDKDVILEDPRHHFYLNGIKFGSLDVLKAFKKKRNEGKDAQDVASIEEVQRTSFILLQPEQVDLLPTGKGKLVVLMPVKNEADKIELALRAHASYADALVVLDDHSEDDTLAIIESLKDECKIERIITKETWERDEPGDRNLMLKAGREIGGTHFVVIDADELFTSNLIETGLLRKFVLNLKPGDRAFFNWIQLWRSLEQFRFDTSVWTWNFKSFAFCDNGTAQYSSEFIHTNRAPDGMNGRNYLLKSLEFGLMHLQFVQWHNLLVKQAWYRILERIRVPDRSAEEINRRYAPSKDETHLGLKPARAEWFSLYHTWLESARFLANEYWRTEQILGWFEQYGREHFKELDIWDIDWDEAAKNIPPKGPALIRVSKEEFYTQADVQAERVTKVIGLIPMKNEADKIELCLRCLAPFVDEIVVFDDGSTDHSVALVTALAKECKVSSILQRENWSYDESVYRQRLIEEGRRLGGTHFICLDADEALTANLLDAQVFKRYLSALAPGYSVALTWIQLWRSTKKYRFDSSIWTNNVKIFAFADDGESNYHEQKFHLGRAPGTLQGDIFYLEGYEYGVLHFQFINWTNLLIKQAWYRCLERVQQPDKPASDINALYAPSKDETDLGLEDAPGYWFNRYPFFTPAYFDKTETWRTIQVLDWFKKHGIETFRPLDIWDVPWSDLARNLLSNEIVPGKLDAIMTTPLTTAESDVVLRLRSIEGWFSDAEGLLMYRLVRKLPDAANILEIGSYMGRSTNAMAYASLGTQRGVYCVDIWLNDGELMENDPQTDKGIQIMAQFIANTNWFRHRLRIMKGAFSQFESLLSAALKFELIFIDAAHDYDNVANDIRIALQCLKPGGVLIGHDYHFKGGEEVVQAVHDHVFARPDVVEKGVFQGTTIWYARFGKTIDPTVKTKNSPYKKALPPRDANIPTKEQLEHIAEKGDTKLMTQVLQYRLKNDWNDILLDRVLLSGLFHLKMSKEATVLAEFMLPKHRTQVDSLENIAVQLDTNGMYATNLKVCKAGMEQFPDRLSFYLLCSDALKGLNRTQEATNLLKAVKKVHPENRAVLRRLGLIHWEEAEQKAQSGTVAANRVVPMPEQPSVSVIVSTYNAERFMEGCLHDLVQQTILPELEIIVIDSGSEQNERAIVERYQQQYKNIVYERTERETVYQAWNRAIKKARGRYITNANTDDRHRSNALELMRNELDRNPDIGLVYADVMITTEENETFERNTAKSMYRFMEHDVNELKKGHCYVGPQPMWRRSIHDEFGYFDDNFVTSGDYEFWVRIADKVMFKKIPQTLGLYLKSPESVEHRNHDRKLIENQVIFQKYGNHKSEQARQYDTSVLKEKVQLTQQVVNLQQDKQYEQALQAVLSFLQKYPEDVDFMYMKGAELYRLGRVDEAIQSFEQLLALYPEHGPSLNNLAIAYWRKGRKQDTKRLLKKVVEQDPENMQAKINLADVLMSLHEFRDAEKLAHAILAEHPRVFEALEIACRMEYARKQYVKGQYYLDVMKEVRPAAPSVKALSELYAAVG